MKHAIQTGDSELTIEERSLLSIGYKRLVAEKRLAWKRVCELETQTSACGGTERLRQAIVFYKEQLEQDVESVCREVLELIGKHVLSTVHAAFAERVGRAMEQASRFKERGFDSLESDLKQQMSGFPFDVEEKMGENLVFYLKMLGDYSRFIAELRSDEDEAARERISMQALCAYYVSWELSKLCLRPSHPGRLGIALNYSMFCQSIMQQPDKACRIAEAAFDDALADLDDTGKELYGESSIIMQVLKENLKLWSQDG
jgi:14-3-3 protein epsilon